jgi:hypothetical protein
MNRKACTTIIALFVLMFLVSGCAPKTDYRSYEDKKEKGTQVFIKELQVCQNFSKENTRQIEGSKGAGERFNNKNLIFFLCMKNKGWILKK